MTMGTKTAGNPVGQALRLGLAGLGVLDQPGHLGQLRVGSDSPGPHHEPAAGVDRGADHLVTWRHFDGHRFTCEHRDVDRRRTVDHLTVGGDLLAGPDHELVAYGQRIDGNALFHTVSQDRDVFGTKLEQCPQCRPGAAFGTRLEVPAGQDEGRDACGDLEIDVAGAVGLGDGERKRVRHPGHPGGPPEQGIQRPAERRDGAHRK